jgi:protease-4
MDPQQNPSQPPSQNAAANQPLAPGNPPAARPQRQRRQPHHLIVEQRSGLGRKFVIAMLLFALGISVMFNFGLYGSYKSYVQTDPSINEKFHSGSSSARDKIAIISLEGAIMDGDGFVKQQIDRVRDDDSVKAVVLRVDSPGGTVTASHYLFHHLKKLQKDKGIPMVVSMGGIAASGGYYVSMAVGDAEDSIFAEETTWTGSIGVIIPNYDVSKLMTDWGIADRSYASGPLKQMGSPTREAATLETETFQQLIDESFAGFKDVITYGRPKLVKDETAMTKVVTGQIFTAKQAQRLGLVDKLGYIEDAVAQAAKLAKLAEDKYRVVEYEKPPGLLDGISLIQSSARPLELGALLDLTAPRAYFLCTWLPSVAANRESLR